MRKPAARSGSQLELIFVKARDGEPPQMGCGATVSLFTNLSPTDSWELKLPACADAHRVHKVRTEGTATKGVEALKRRDMIRSLVCAAAAIPTASSAKQPIKIENCQQSAARIAAMMEKSSGGKWRVDIQPDFVLIFKVPAQRHSAL